MSDQTDFAALKTAVNAGRVHIDVDLKRVCDPGCPLAFGHLKERLVYAYLGLVAAGIASKTWFNIPTEAFWIAIGVGSVLYWTLVRKFAEHRMRRYVVTHILEDENRWKQLWRFGGITIGGNDGATVQGPNGDWRAVIGVHQV